MFSKLKSLAPALLLGLLVSGFLWLLVEIRTDVTNIDMKISKLDSLSETMIHYQRNMYQEISRGIIRDVTLDKRQTAMEEGLDNLRLTIEDFKPYIDVNQSAVEKNIVDSVYYIINESWGSQGSGVMVKYNNKFYVFSVGHMSDASDDAIYLKEGDRKLCQLSILIDDDNLDFAVFGITDPEFVPTTYVELADSWVKKEEIYICGNPLGIEDMFSEGRIIKDKDSFVYFYDHVYFGSSGGGIFNKKGQLIGNISHMRAMQPNPDVPAFLIHGATDLDKMKALLKQKGF